MKIKKLHRNATIPTYATAGAACFDLYACGLPEYGTMIINAETICTGLAMEIPAGQALEIYSRSGHGFNSDMRLANAVGIIDADYRGEIKVRLTVDGARAVRIKNGDRIAQAKLVPAPQIAFELVDELSDTERGAGGFGSTGQ